ncbi:uncharacterized protein [Coffea arabica]|uniref:Uncharacterized protein isoform X2 n=1 Tax=Coffea arabica TaxID=13443 RepID=A0ABM4WYA4_COFAR
MVLSRKRHHNSNNSFVPPYAQPPNSKVPKSTAAAASNVRRQTVNDSVSSSSSVVVKFVSVLADAGCTLINPTGPPCLPSDLLKLRLHLQRRFSDDSALRADFLSGLSSYINVSSDNLRRVLLPSHCESNGSLKSESLMRVLLLVEAIQLHVQNILLEKLPEFFDLGFHDRTSGSSSLRLDEDIARLILNQFRWLDFLVDSQAFTEKLLQVLSICPLHLKKEIIGSLPEVIGVQHNKVVVDSLQQMLHEDSSIIVPVLDTFSNINLDDLLQDQVTAVALSCIRTVEVEDMPYLLRFLLLSATPKNARRIISKIREQLKFLGLSTVMATQHSKLKGKVVANNADALVLDALKSSIRFKNMLCEEILKVLQSVEKVQDHKMIDMWFFVLVYMNCEALQKSVLKLLKKKIIEGCIEEAMFYQCIHGNKDLVQDYLPIFLSISEYLTSCKEKTLREFSNHMYTCLFEELHDTYSRQEILGALASHVGSGISLEVNTALEAMLKLTSKHPEELVQLASHLTGILDYLESFNTESLHKVYEVFSLLALSAQSCSDSCGSSIKNELLMIIRKQVNHVDLSYKRMGLIGTLKVVSLLGDGTSPSPSQKSNYEEALELLETSFESCKQLPLPLILFYEELAATMQNRMLHPAIIEWIGKHVGEFESKFLSDLDGGELPSKGSYCGLEGELWMNLDGDISPVCLNILPLISSSLRSPSPLQILPAYFVLLSAIESLVNQGSLGGIDALLGCPLHLPSSKYLSDSMWQSLSGKQKQTIILCLYYAANWIRELLNAFCSQVTENFDSISQATKEEITLKLLKRLRNLIFLESLINESLKKYPLCLPELYPCMETLSSSQYQMGDLEKKSELIQENRSVSQKSKRNIRKTSKVSKSSTVDDKLKQPTIIEMLKKAGSITSQEILNEDSSGKMPKGSMCEDGKKDAPDSDIIRIVEIFEAVKKVEAQKHKFRPIRVHCYSILAFKKNQELCCSDPSAELPLHLYLLRELNQKLDYFSPLSKQISLQWMSLHPGFSEMKGAEFLHQLRPLFPFFKGNLDCAISGLKEGDEVCQYHWKDYSTLAGNPSIVKMVVSKSLVYSFVFVETLCCFGKILNLTNILNDKTALSDLLEAFQSINMPESFFQGMQLIPATGSIDYLYCGTYYFLEGVFDAARTIAYKLASEVVVALESVTISIQKFLDKSVSGSAKGIDPGSTKELLIFLRNRLGASAQKLLFQKRDDIIDKSSKIKGHIVQKVLHIYLENCQSTSDSLNELACSILPQVTSQRTAVEDDQELPTLSPSTFVSWYRVMTKEVAWLEKPRAAAKVENVEKLLDRLQQSVNVVVSLVNMCRTHDKVSVHGMAVKYGGKFVDSFLKVFGFLQAQFQMHNEQIISMVKELQKATRTIQTLCSEAKVSKQTAITSKIPATKRSMERFLFHVKALLHGTSSECTFWMGNLKHKNLMGHVVSSQAYVDDQNENIQSKASEVNVADEPMNVACE